MIHERSVKAWSSTIAVAGVIGVLLPFTLGWQHLPEPMATHWGISGTERAGYARVCQRDDGRCQRQHGLAQLG